MSDLTLLPGATVIEREIPNVGVLRYEDARPGEWLTKKGSPAKVPLRRYLLNGARLDSVSSIVDTLRKPALERWLEREGVKGGVLAERTGELDGVPDQEWPDRVRLLGLGASAKRDEGADRGTVIHMAMEDLCAGRTPNPADVPGIARPWVQGALRAWLALDPEPLLVEQMVCHPELGYAGRPDLVALVDGKRTLLDWKSGKGRVFDAAHWQTRLYAMALERLGEPVDQIVVVGIGDQGDYEVIECAVGEVEARALLIVHSGQQDVAAGMRAQRAVARYTARRAVAA